MRAMLGNREKRSFSKALRMAKLNTVGKMIGLDIFDDIKDLWEKGQNEATLLQVARACDISYTQAYSGISALVDMGLVRLFRRQDRNELRVVPLDYEPPACDLTKKQRASIDWLFSRADENMCVRASFRDICEGALLSKGAIVAHLEALERKGYLSFIEVGRGTRKTLFRLFPNGDGPGQSVIRRAAGPPTAPPPPAP